MSPIDVVKGPVITEKGTLVNEQGNQVVFRVHPHANKVEIKRAVRLQGLLVTKGARAAIEAAGGSIAE